MVDVVGSYELLARLTDASSATRAGSKSGQRWRGRDTAHGRDVRLRQIGPGASSGSTGPAGQAAPIATIDGPRTGVRVLAGLSHPNIVALLDKVEADGQIWLIDEPADGITLDALLERASWPTPCQSLGIVRGVLKGLAYVHSSRALHGSINPANVLLDVRGTARLTDFGSPAPGMGTGSERAVAFLSPEAAGGLGVSVRSDVYSVGAVLAMLLAANIEPGLRPLLDRSMAKDPTERYLDAEEFLEAIEDSAELSLGESWLEQASIVGLLADAAVISPAAE
jgi:serine/threonine protein kinase